MSIITVLSLFFCACSIANVSLSGSVGGTLPQLNSRGRYCISLVHILVQRHLTISSVVHRLLFTGTMLIPAMLMCYNCYCNSNFLLCLYSLLFILV